MSTLYLVLNYFAIKDERQFHRQIVSPCSTTLQNINEKIITVDPPYDCCPGEKMIVFLKNPQQLANGTGVFVADLVSRRTLECSKYEYKLAYDDSILALGVAGLTQCDVLKVCCYGCDAQYIESTGSWLLTGDGGNSAINFGDTVIFAGGDGIDTVASDPQTVTIDVQISTDVGNVVAIGTDGGLFVNQFPGTIFNLAADSGPAQAISALNTMMIEGGIALTSTAVPTDRVKIDLQLSTLPGNVAIIGGDGGLFVPVTGGGAPVTLAGDTGTSQQIAPGDTLTITGGAAISTVATPTDTMVVNLALSADVGNTAVFGADGNLFVPASAGGPPITVVGNSGPNQSVAAGDTFTISGGVSTATRAAATDTILIDLLFSADVGNVATLGTDSRLFVPTPTVPTIPTLTGSNAIGVGTFPGHVISLIVSPSGGNTASITPTGLFVPGTTLTASNTIAVGTFPNYTPAVIISPNAGNILTAVANGLFVQGTTLTGSNGIAVGTSPAYAVSITLSPNAGNAATVLANGLFVQTISLTGSNAIAVGTTPAYAVSLTISPNAGNIATVAANGLFVPATVSSSLTTTTAYTSGATHYQHTANNLTVVDFAGGFQTVRASAVCATPGVATNKMVRAVSIVANELVVDSAPEHFSLTTQQTIVTGTADISSVTDLLYGETAINTINNPSTCRALNLLAVCEFQTQANMTAGGFWARVGQLAINGGAYNTLINDRHGPLIGGPNGMAWNMMGGYQNQVAAGGSITIRARQAVTSTITGAGSSIIDARTRFTVIGMTT